MRVMGIDPGSNFMGLGCVEKQKANNLICIGHDLVKVNQGGKVPVVDRLGIIYQAVTEKIKLWQPDMVAIESVFLAKNAQSALKLGQARGAAITAVAMRGLELHEYAAREIKLAVTSQGSADKLQVQRMVELLLGRSLTKIGKIKKDDVADALAIAVCHLSHHQLNLNTAKTRRATPKNPNTQAI